MIRLLDGPAAGDMLQGGRCPIMLRVERVGGEWRALDQLNDRPGAGTDLIVYITVGQRGSCHIDGRDPATGKRFGRTEHAADYRRLPVQPADQDIRTNEAWLVWCESNRDALLAEAARAVPAVAIEAAKKAGGV